MQNVNELSAGTLAFVGDAVYGLLVREKLAETNRPSGELHRLSVAFVNANSQAEAFKIIEPVLTEKELSHYKHGRNLHTNNVPKQSTVAQYHSATGLEALFGYLHLSGQTDRINELFEIIWQAQNNNL
jgi:ribonuclease-3 family protein